MTNTDLEMPTYFPKQYYKDIKTRIDQKKDSHKESWHEFAGGWNGIKYRFLACNEHKRAFTESIKLFSPSPPFPHRYIQERELFGFFTTGLSTIECFCYSLYSIASIINSKEFPIDDASLRYVTPSNVKNKFSKDEAFKYSKIKIELEKLIGEEKYNEWCSIRNILVHRSSPGRHFFYGGEHHGKTKWMKEISIDVNTTSSRFDWLKNKITILLKATDIFTKEKII